MPPSDAAFLLEALIESVPRLILPYVSPIQKALVAKLRALGSAPSSVLGIMSASPLVPALGQANGISAPGPLMPLKVRCFHTGLDFEGSISLHHCVF